MHDPEARLRRLLSLIPYVLKHQGATIDELCEVFEVSRGELIGDLNLIFLCGQPDYTPADLIDVVMDEDRVYIGMADYFARPLRFTPSELRGLYLACRALAELSGAAASSSLYSAMEKIGRALGLEVEGAPDVERSLEFGSPSTEKEKLAELVRACEGRLWVEMEYYSYGRDEITRRRVGPLSLEFGAGHWYLRAWDEKSGESRVFRVDRIKELEVTSEEFEPRGEEEAGAAAAEVRDAGEIEVRLRFAPSLAAWAREQPIFSSLQEDGEGLECTLRTDRLSWLGRELLRYGTRVEVLEPEELKEELRRRVKATLSVYKGEGPRRRRRRSSGG